MVNANGSPKTVDTSWNETPCLAWFCWSFSWSHSNSIPVQLYAAAEESHDQPNDILRKCCAVVHRANGLFGIGHEAARFFVRKSRSFGEPAKAVIHRPVQTGEERDDLLALALLLISEGILRGPDRDIHEKIALNRRPAEAEVYLRLDRDPLQKFIGQKNFLAAKLEQSPR